MDGVLAIYNSLPRWATVIWWVVVSAAIEAVRGLIATGELTINPAYVPIINIVLVAIKDFINTHNLGAIVKSQP